MIAVPEKRSALFITLYGVFLLVFVATPLWNWFPGQGLKCALVAAISLSGFFWAYGATTYFRQKPTAFAKRNFLLAVAVVLALNFKAVQSGIPWRGDEDHHMRVTWALALWLQHLLPIFGCMAVVWAWSFFKPWRLRSPRTIAAATLLAATVFLLARRLHFDYYPALRYPYFLRYLCAPPLAMAAHLFHADPPPEWLFRLAPMVAATATVWLVMPPQQLVASAFRFEFAVYLASIPLLWYYSSILYLELPAVFLMTAVCLHAEEFLTGENPAWPWLALLLIGFIKETTLPFLLAWVFCRAVAAAWRNRKSFAFFSWVWEQSQQAYCVLWPLLLYLLLRFKLGNPRAYLFHPQHLISPLLLKITAQAWAQQFGVLLFFAAAGLVLLCKQRRGLTVLFLLLTLAGPFLVETMDTADYIGLSRFNLLLLPGLLALSRESFTVLWHKPLWLTAMLPAMIAVNFIMTPVHADGSKIPKWGNYLCDEGEHYYPYREAFHWMAAHASGQNLKMTGLDYPYWTDFYHPLASSLEVDFMPKPRDESRALDSLLAVSHRQGFRLILFQVRGKTLPTWNDAEYSEKTFANQAHTLMLFAAKP